MTEASNTSFLNLQVLDLGFSYKTNIYKSKVVIGDGMSFINVNLVLDDTTNESKI